MTHPNQPLPLNTRSPQSHYTTKLLPKCLLLTMAPRLVLQETCNWATDMYPRQRYPVTCDNVIHGLQCFGCDVIPTTTGRRTFITTLTFLYYWFIEIIVCLFPQYITEVLYTTWKLLAPYEVSCKEEIRFFDVYGGSSDFKEFFWCDILCTMSTMVQHDRSVREVVAVSGHSSSLSTKPY